MKARRIAFLGLMVALAFVLSYVEMLLPINIGIPGAKIGLANLVVMVALYKLGPRD
ncbi:MAG: Gx transporter family protein, partial [Lachnospiraceae bacterium]|nr:Gx transporter family protein [Lachnospiraceae bacterium]